MQCSKCGQERDDDEDGGLVVKATQPDGTVTIGLAVCAATDDCWAECVRLTDEFLTETKLAPDANIQLQVTFEDEEN